MILLSADHIRRAVAGTYPTDLLSVSEAIAYAFATGKLDRIPPMYNDHQAAWNRLEPWQRDLVVELGGSAPAGCG